MWLLLLCFYYYYSLKPGEGMEGETVKSTDDGQNYWKCCYSGEWAGKSLIASKVVLY